MIRPDSCRTTVSEELPLVTPDTSSRALGDIIRRATSVPARQGFPTVDEVAERMRELGRRHPDRLSARQVATSRDGEPIMAWAVAGGPHQHLVVGGVHPDEPIGSWTAMHLVEQLLEDHDLRDALDATWTVVPIADPDGMRLNEGWFADPTDRAARARSYYRPAPAEQVEWTFPFHYKRARFGAVMPETRGLMSLIDELRPRLYSSLHNAEMGGVYHYLSRPEPDLVPSLHAIVASLGLPLDVGEAESPLLERYAPAVYGTGKLETVYDHLDAQGVDPVPLLAGSSSTEYARRHGALSVIAELPFWSHPDAADTRTIDETYAHLVGRTAEDMRLTARMLDALLDRARPHLVQDTALRRAAVAFVPIVAQQAEDDRLRALDPKAARPATVAERFGCEDLVQCFRLRYGGILRRALRFEQQSRNATGTIDPGGRLAALVAEADALHERWIGMPSTADSATVIPVAHLIGVQYGTLLAAAAHLDLRCRSTVADET